MAAGVTTTPAAETSPGMPANQRSVPGSAMKRGQQRLSSPTRARPTGAAQRVARRRSNRGAESRLGVAPVIRCRRRCVPNSTQPWRSRGRRPAAPLPGVAQRPHRAHLCLAALAYDGKIGLAAGHGRKESKAPPPGCRIAGERSRLAAPAPPSGCTSEYMSLSRR